MDETEVCDELHRNDSAVEAARAALPPEEELTGMAELFKVFGDATRMKILCILAGREVCVCDIAAALSLTQPAVSYQLRVLRTARLVRFRRAGKTAYYTLSDDHVATIVGMAKAHLEER